MSYTFEFCFYDYMYNYVTSNKTSHMLQNMKLHKSAFNLKMSKYVHFLFSQKQNICVSLCQSN